LESCELADQTTGRHAAHLAFAVVPEWLFRLTNSKCLLRAIARATLRNNPSWEKFQRTQSLAGFAGTIADEFAFGSRRCLIGDQIMSVGTILLIILILALIGAFPAWPYSSGWGYYPSGGIGLILIIVLILLLMGRI